MLINLSTSKFHYVCGSEFMFWNFKSLFFICLSRVVDITKNKNIITNCFAKAKKRVLRKPTQSHATSLAEHSSLFICLLAPHLDIKPPQYSYMISHDVLFNVPKIDNRLYLHNFVTLNVRVKPDTTHQGEDEKWEMTKVWIFRKTFSIDVIEISIRHSTPANGSLFPLRGM